MEKEVKTGLWNRNFTLIVIGQLISLLGNSIQRFAFSLYILDLTGSAGMFSLLLSLQIIPIILLSPVGGAIADRYNKGKLMVAMDVISGGLIGGVALLYSNGNRSVFWVGVAMITLSILNSIYDPTVRASIPLVLEKDQYGAGNGIVGQISALTMLAGPVLAGFLYGWVGIWIILLLNTISYFFAAGMELFLRIPYKKENALKNPVREVVKDLKDSMVYLGSEKKIVLYMIFVAACANLFLTPLYTVGVPYVEKIIFGVSDKWYGISEGIFGIGMMVGALLVPVMEKKIAFEKIHVYFIVIGFMVIGMGSSVTPIVMGKGEGHNISFLIFTVFLFLMMVAIANVNIQTMTYIQKQVREDMMGKTMAFTTSVTAVFMPIGQVLFGQLYDNGKISLVLVYGCSTAISLLGAMIIRALMKSHHYQKTVEVQLC